MDQMISTLIGERLAGQLTRSAPVIGAEIVSLMFVPDAKPGTLMPGSRQRSQRSPAKC
ncbi:MAG: hypothetical protein JOY71_06105 [Acetobacteraceae bacterium]|nr:hypothetical protein [Acetobacteraceae bacterium]